MPQLTPAQYQLAANTLRMLAVDAVERANSGHPGMPMGAADYAFVLWHDFLRFDPQEPDWPNRDRFILSAGHGSMLLYGLLHLFGYDLTLDDIKNFRQWGSKTPGHPECGHTPGVEVTTGPLGQGFAMGVGMALASAMAAARFNTTEQRVIDHYVYAIVSDGDLMEGISHEAASLAGHLRLGNIIYIYDDNGITIDGKTDISYSDDVARRFTSYGWQVQAIDGHDHGQIRKAIRKAQRASDRPSLIIAKTHIGQGSPGKHDTPGCHGSPLGADEALATRKNLDWHDATFFVPEEVRNLCLAKSRRARREHRKWSKGFEAWSTFNPDRAKLWERMLKKEVPADLMQQLLVGIPPEAAATRVLSGKALQKIAALVPSLVAGSADLAGSTNIAIKDGGDVGRGEFGGRNVHYGIREHAMAAVMNGLVRYGFFIPVGSTFLVFSDYCRPSIRLSALMKQQTIYVFTHDSIFLGEDGPTHQPIEHLSALRLIPNLLVLRPADAVETAASWSMALERREGPTALILSRQKLPIIEHGADFKTDDIRRGGYTSKVNGDRPRVAIFATGSEVALAVAAATLLYNNGVENCVVSVPCLEQFLAQPKEQRDSAAKGAQCLVAIEAGRGGLWRQLVGERGLFIGLEGFGASAPEAALAREFGLTPDQVADRIKQHMIPSVQLKENA